MVDNIRNFMKRVFRPINKNSGSVGLGAFRNLRQRKRILEPENLEWLLFSEIVYACYQKIQDYMGALQWKVVGSDTVAKMVDYIDNKQSFSSITQNIVMAYFFGYQIARVVWDKTSGKRTVSRVEFLDIKEYSISQDGTVWDKAGKQCFGGKKEGYFTIYNDEQTFAPKGIGVLQVVADAAILLDKVRGWREIHTEQNAMPKMMVRYPESYGANRVHELLEEIKNSVLDSAMAAPRGVDIEWKENSVQNSLDLFESITARLEKSITLAMIGTDTMLEGKSNTYATATAHSIGFYYKIQKLSRLVEGFWNSVFNEMRNYSIYETPDFYLRLIDREREQELLKMEIDKDLSLKNLGVQFTSEELRQKYYP